MLVYWIRDVSALQINKSLISLTSRLLDQTGIVSVEHHPERLGVFNPRHFIKT